MKGVGIAPKLELVRTQGQKTTLCGKILLTARG